MNLSELEQRSSFALLGPGFSGEGWVLVEPSPNASVEVVFAPYESAGRDAVRFRGTLRQLDALRFDTPAPSLEPILDESNHRESVEQIRAAIAAGDVYQVNHTLRARLPEVRGSELLSLLCRVDTPRFAAWVRFHDGDEIVSASPELFFRADGFRLTCEPMKGTARRSEAGALETSEKDRAELAMITDLLRNDMTPLCHPRSVRVTEERRFIELPYAVQTVSEIEGHLLEEITAIDVLDALHPGGSITGAPKRAAMEMIRQLEPEPRGAYCGALGLVQEGRAVFSILIRTAERLGDGWRYGVGGGIVWDSDPALELDEARLKLGALR